jgi:hypothetical protein
MAFLKINSIYTEYKKAQNFVQGFNNSPRTVFLLTGVMLLIVTASLILAPVIAQGLQGSQKPNLPTSYKSNKLDQSNNIVANEGKLCGVIPDGCQTATSYSGPCQRSRCAQPFYCRTDALREIPLAEAKQCNWDLDCPGRCFRFNPKNSIDASRDTKAAECPAIGYEQKQPKPVVPVQVCGQGFPQCEKDFAYCMMDPESNYGHTQKQGICVKYRSCGGNRRSPGSNGQCAAGWPPRGENPPGYVCIDRPVTGGKIGCGMACDMPGIMVPTSWSCNDMSKCPFPMACVERRVPTDPSRGNMGQQGWPEKGEGFCV